MDPRTWTRVCELFDRVVELPTADRAAALDEACGPADAAVRAEVERMLAADRTRADLDEPVFRIPASDASVPEADASAAARAPRPGTRVGRFEIVDVLAEGGMATVFRARQTDPARTVALKMRRGDPFSESGLRRFRYEAEILASLRHPGIAQLYEAGTLRRRIGDAWVQQPWVALELVDDARDIVAYAWSKELPLADRLELFEQVCDAVSWAHRHGVLHRDLKPGNILVDGEGRVRVIDFGIASSAEPPADGARLTLEGQVLGTLATMSPEQLAGRSEHVDVRTDVYALGVVLYELIEQASPRALDGLSLAEAVAVVRDAPIRPPRRAPRELGWVLRRALEPDPERRYASVEQLAEDLRRWRGHEPLRAGPPSRVYALRKFVRRHRAAVAAGLAIVAALGVGLVRAEVLRGRAEEARADALLESRRVTAIHDFVLGMVLNAGGPDATVVDLLDSGRARLDTLLGDEPRVRASAQATLAKAYLNVDRVEPGRELLEAALSWELEHGVPGSETWLQVQLDWMPLLLRERRCADALELCERLLPWAEADTPATRANLLARRGVMQRCLGRVAAARASFEAALAAYREHGLEGAPDYWNAWEALAECQAELGDLEASLASKEAIVAGREALLGPEDSLVAASLSALGTAYTDLGRWAEGLPHLERGLEIMTRTQGRDHWGRAMALNNLACALMQLGRFDEARARFAECIALAERYRGSELAVGEAREAGFLAHVNLGFLERHLGRTDEAIAHFEEALEGYADRRSSPSWRAAQTALAKEYEKLELWAEAAELARAACASHDRVPSAAVRLADLEIAVRTSLAAGAAEPLAPLLEAELDRRSAAGVDPAPVRALAARVEAAHSAARAADRR